MGAFFVQSCAVFGVDVHLIRVEVSITTGLPKCVIVGLPDAAVQESRERVRSALLNAGFRYPRGRITVNLSPADLRKYGPMYDLPIALGILAAQGDIPRDALADALVVGELNLHGDVVQIRGTLLVAELARSKGLRLLCPKDNTGEALLAGARIVYGASALGPLVDALSSNRLNDLRAQHPLKPRAAAAVAAVDLALVRGQEFARRALEICATGRHNMVFRGAPGSGKTMLAKALPGILPPLSPQDYLEVLRIHSVAGIADALAPGRPPFRSPHHTASASALVGGGTIPRPGELSLAHKGVLFLDELPEFSRQTIELLRQPLEDKSITISRASGSCAFPTDCILLAAMNPCPCGYSGSTVRACSCVPSAVARYQSVISGPVLDRIDLFVEFPHVSYRDLVRAPPGESSAVVRARVLQARTLLEQQKAPPKERLSPDAHHMVERAFRAFHLTGRGFDRVLRVASSIAALAGSWQIEPAHVSEALSYRSR